MHCENCGHVLNEGEKFCSNCGTPVDREPSVSADGVVDMGGPVEGAGANAGEGAGEQPGGFNYQGNGDQANGFNYQGNGGQANGFNYQGNGGQANGFNYQGNGGQANGFNYQGPLIPLRTDRSLLLFVLLSFVTCGIYSLVFIYLLAEDVNKACYGDGEETPGLLMFLLLSIVTCGIYSYIWYYKLGERLSRNLQRYGIPSGNGGVEVLLWMLLGQFLCGIGPFVAWYIIINNTNMVCGAWNRANGLMG